MRAVLPLILLLALGMVKSSAQNYLSDGSFGFTLGFGVLNEELPEEVDYRPHRFAARYKIGLLRSPKRINLHIGLHPAFVVAEGIGTTIEFGINLSLKTSFLVGENQILYAGAGAGPHYLGLNSSKQARGYIFSDNFFIGTSRRISILDTQLELFFELSYRHISNAGFKDPNGGIDNGLVNFGISKILGKRKKEVLD